MISIINPKLLRYDILGEHKFQPSTLQFHTDPLSSTHHFHTRTTPFRHPKPLSSAPKSFSSTPKIPSVQHQNPFRLSTKNPSVPQHNPSDTLLFWEFFWVESLKGFWTKTFGAELRRFWWELRSFWCRTEGCVELRGVCRTEGFSVWN